MFKAAKGARWSNASLTPVYISSTNILTENITLNPLKVGHAMHELSKPRRLEQIARMPLYAHNAVVRYINGQAS